MGSNSSISTDMVEGGKEASSSMTFGLRLSLTRTLVVLCTHACLTIIALMIYRKRPTAPKAGPSGRLNCLVTFSWKFDSDRNGSNAKNPPTIAPMRVASSMSRRDQAWFRASADAELVRSILSISISPPCCKCLVGADVSGARRDGDLLPETIHRRSMLRSLANCIALLNLLLATCPSSSRKTLEHQHSPRLA